MLANRISCTRCGLCSWIGALVLALSLPVISGCTIERLKAGSGDTLEALDLRSGIAVSRNRGFRLSPTTPVFLQHRRHSDPAELDVAQAGLSRVFYSVSPADPDALPAMGLLMVLDPPRPDEPATSSFRVRLLPIEHLLPRLAPSATYRVHLLDLAADQIIDVVELTIDPAAYRRESAMRVVLEQGFERFGHALISPNDA